VFQSVLFVLSDLLAECNHPFWPIERLVTDELFKAFVSKKNAQLIKEPFDLWKQFLRTQQDMHTQQPNFH
jgi:hypothetical protein